MNKGQGKQFSFTREGFNEKEKAIDEAKKELWKLKKDGRWEEALVAARDLWPRVYMEDIIDNVIIIKVREAQFSWMLVSKRLQIPKGIALMIKSFIDTNTDSGLWDKFWQR